MSETAVETRNKELSKNAFGLLEKLKPSIAAVLPKHLTPERMAMIAFTAMRRNPELMKCSAQSIIGSIMTASMLGLEPSGPLGHGALVPYKGECQFQPMFQGLLELARRSGVIKDVQLRAVYKGDHYKFSFGLDPMIEHVPLEGDGADSPDRECTHVYCIIRFNNGGIQWDQMSFAQAIAHGKRFSKTWNTREYPNKFKPGTPWADHPVAMCLKTILKQTLKLCPKSPEMAQAMFIDDLTETGRPANMKQLEDGSFDVEFDDPASGDGDDSQNKGTVNVDEIRAGSEQNRGHGNEKLAGAVGGNGSGAQAPAAKPETKNSESAAAPQSAEPAVDPEAPITDDRADMLNSIASHHEVSQAALLKFVKTTLGYKMFSHLKNKNYDRVVAFLKNGGRE